MKIIKVGSNNFIDEELRNYILNIWNMYNIEIANDSNILFAKNTNIPKLITDYLNKNINRVRLKEKADYCIINHFNISDYVQYYDGVNICSDDSKEIVYGIYNLKDQDIETIKLILDFITINPNIKYVNQDVLNNSLNNGFIITNENYYTLQELIDSDFQENHELAIKMVINSSLKDNYEWLLYLYFGKYQQIYNYDDNHILSNYFQTLGFSHGLRNLTNDQDYSIDKCLSVITNEIIKDKFISKMRNLQFFASEKMKK